MGSSDHHRSFLPARSDHEKPMDEEYSTVVFVLATKYILTTLLLSVFPAFLLLCVVINFGHHPNPDIGTAASASAGGISGQNGKSPDRRDKRQYRDSTRLKVLGPAFTLPNSERSGSTAER